MHTEISLLGRLGRVLLPTKLQALVCLLLALAIVIAANIRQIFSLLGIDHSELDTALVQFHDRYSQLLTSQVASSTALITFWATVGLVAYLICWSAYNVIIEARNEVTLETQYTNRGHHWRGPYETLALKVVAAIVLIGTVGLLRAEFHNWLALAAPAFTAPDLYSIGMAIIAVVGLALQLYLVLALVIVTFTPWYSKEAFTQSI